MGTIGILLSIVLLGPPTGLEKVDAKAWLNVSELPEEDADYILFFFALRSDRETDSTVRHLGMLNRLDRDPSIRVLGLTPEHPGAVEPFVKKHDVRFAVGAGSRCARRFDVRRPPALVRLKRGQDARPLSFEEAKRLAAGVSSHVRELSKMELREFVTGDANGHARAAAIARLYGKMERSEYIAFAESRMAEESNPWVRGRLEYFVDLAKGIPRSDEEMSDSAYAYNLFRESRDAPEWQEVRGYFKARDEGKFATVEKLWAEYLSHDTMELQDVLVRRFVTEDLWKAADRDASRPVLMDIVAIDLDPSIRMIATMALGQVCPTGDEEAADFLDEMAAVEANITRVRPMMKYVSHMIRTGQEDERTMPSPAP
jgi:hypothetical protein